MALMELEGVLDPFAPTARQPKPVGVRKHGYVGDTVARRTKGQVGERTKQFKVFRSLALHKLGDCSYGDVADPVFAGQLQKLEGWVEQIPLTEPARRRLLRHGFDTTYGDGRMKSARDYVNLGNQGRVLPFDNGEYASIEQRQDFYSLSWTSALPLQPAIEALLNGVGSDYVPTEAGIVEAQEWVQGAPQMVLQHIRDHFSEITFARFNGERLAFAWRSDAGSSDDGQINLHECFVVCAFNDRRLLGKLLYATATPSIGAASTQVLDGFEDLLRQYPASRA